MTIFVRRVEDHPAQGGAKRRRYDILVGEPRRADDGCEKIGSYYTFGANGDPDHVEIDCAALARFIRVGHSASPQVRKIAKTECPGVDLSP